MTLHFFSQLTEQSDKICITQFVTKMYINIAFHFMKALILTRNEYRKSLSYSIVRVQSKKLISNGVTNTTHTSQYPISGSSHIQYFFA